MASITGKLVASFKKGFNGVSSTALHVLHHSFPSDHYLALLSKTCADGNRWHKLVIMSFVESRNCKFLPCRALCMMCPWVCDAQGQLPILSCLLVRLFPTDARPSVHEFSEGHIGAASLASSFPHIPPARKTRQSTWKS